MDTFGPVVLVQAYRGTYEHVCPTLPMAPSIPAGARAGLFLDRHTADDYKPVVHAKYGFRTAPPPIQVGGRVYLWSQNDPNTRSSMGGAWTVYRSTGTFALSLALGYDRINWYYNGFRVAVRVYWMASGNPIAVWARGTEVFVSWGGRTGISWPSYRVSAAANSTMAADTALFIRQLLDTARDDPGQNEAKLRAMFASLAVPLFEALEPQIDRYMRDSALRIDKGAVKTRVSSYSIVEPNVSSGFLFNEPEIMTFGQPALLPPSAAYQLNLARSRAFVEACDSMPRLSDNSISNVSEILEFLLSIIRHEPPKLPTRLNEAWLAYRYQYSTTKMDLREAWDFIDRYYDVGSMFPSSRLHGKYSFDYQGTNVVLKVSLTAAPTVRHWKSDFGGLWRAASQLGFAPDLYYLWDSTPFSFIVDWFLPVGDVLSSIDAGLLYRSENYTFSDIVYSLKYSRAVDGVNCTFYSRWLESTAPTISPLYWLETKSPSKRQVAYRALDAVSLVIGGLFR